MLWILDRFVNFGRLSFFGIEVGVVQSPGLSSLRDVLGEGSVDQASVESQVESRLEVSRLEELASNPRFLIVLLVVEQNGFAQVLVIHVFFEDRFSCQHSSLHRVVSSLDLGHVQEASGASCEHASWEVELRDSVISSLVENSGSVGNAFTSFEHFLEIRVGLQPLELLVGVEVWVLVVQTDNETEVDDARCLMVHETTSVVLMSEWPSDSVLNETWFKMRIALIDMPHFLKTNSVVLDAWRLGLEFVLGLELLSQ